MKQLALARMKREESIAPRVLAFAGHHSGHMQVNAVPTQFPQIVSSQNQHTHTTLQLSGVIGNRALQRVLNIPTVQRSLWDDVTETIDSATDWLTGDSETPADAGWETDSPMSDPDVTEEALEHANEPEFKNAVEDNNEQPQSENTGSSWFDSFFGSNEQEQQDFMAQNASDEASEYAETNQCESLEHEIQRLSDLIRELYDISQSMLPNLEAAKQAYDSLQKKAPGSPQAEAARRRFEELLAPYNEVLNRFDEAWHYREALKAELAACKENEEREKKKMPKGFPCC